MRIVIVYRPRSLAVFEAADRVFGLEIQKLAKFLDRRFDCRDVIAGHFRYSICGFMEDVTVKQPEHMVNGCQ